MCVRLTRVTRHPATADKPVWNLVVNLATMIKRRNRPSQIYRELDTSRYPQTTPHLWIKYWGKDSYPWWKRTLLVRTAKRVWRAYIRFTGRWFCNWRKFLGCPPQISMEPLEGSITSMKEQYVYRNTDSTLKHQWLGEGMFFQTKMNWSHTKYTTATFYFQINTEHWNVKTMYTYNIAGEMKTESKVSRIIREIWIEAGQTRNRTTDLYCSRSNKQTFILRSRTVGELQNNNN